jgi:hypothetical protein
LDDASFRAAADRLHEEGFGLCLAWSRKDSVAAFAQIVIDHIGAVVYVGRDTGLLTLKLIRDGYDADALPHFDADTGLLAIDEDESITVSEMTNEVIVKYVAPSDGKERTARLKNNAAIRSAGAVFSETRDYPGLPTAELALRVAARDLKAASGGVKKFGLRLSRRAALLHPGDVFVISDPTRNIGRMVLRAGRCEYGEGTDGTVKIEAVQDVFGLPQTAWTGTETPAYIPPDMTPYPIAEARIIEAPYRFLTQIDPRMAALDVHSGFLTALAAAPTPLSYGFEVWTKTGANAYAQGSDDNGTFCARALLETAIGPKETTLVLTAPDDATGLLYDFETGGAALIEEEWLRVDALSLDESDPEHPVVTLTVGRGCCDSVPKPHPAGAVVWFVEDGGGADLREYVSGASVSARLLTVTPGGTLALDDAPESSLAIAGRAGRPYPPGNFRINGEAYPDSITGQLTVSWSHRDRLTQADLLIDTTCGDIGPEPGVTYELTIHGDGGEEIASETGLSGTSYTLANETGGSGDVALLHFDGDFEDATGLSTWTKSGTVDFAAGKFGQAAAFTGAAESRIIAPAPFFGSGDFTVEAWVDMDAVQPNGAIPLWLASPGNSWSSNVWGIFLYRTGASSGDTVSPSLWLYNYSANAPILAATSDLRGAGWTHLAVTKAGNLWTLRINGVAEANRAHAFSFSRTGFTQYVGAGMLGGTYNGLNGRIDELRVTKGMARYTEDFTPPNAPFTPELPQNSRLRVTLSSERDGLKSAQSHEWTVTRT